MYSLAIFLPLIGAIIAGFFGRMIGNKGSQYVTCGLLIASAVISVIAFIDIALLGNTHTANLGTWISSGTFEARWALRREYLLEDRRLLEEEFFPRIGALLDAEQKERGKRMLERWRKEQRFKLESHDAKVEAAKEAEPEEPAKEPDQSESDAEAD